MKRYHKDIPLMERRAREWKSLVGDTGKERGRFRKRKPLDCGKSRCQCCHGEAKFPKRIPTRHELQHEECDIESQKHSDKQTEA